MSMYSAQTHFKLVPVALAGIPTDASKYSARRHLKFTAKTYQQVFSTSVSADSRQERTKEKSKSRHYAEALNRVVAGRGEGKENEKREAVRGEKEERRKRE